MIQEDRISYLNEKDEQEGRYIIYWMQASQRVKYNQALETTIRIANKRSLPVLVYFEITTSFPDANLRHYYFMLEGLQEVKQKLNNMGIQMIIGSQDNSRYSNLASLAKEAAMVITDCGYLRFQTEWREKYAQDLPCLMIQVESDVVIPVESISSQEEFNTGSFRVKVHRWLADYLQPMDMSEPRESSLDFRIASFPIEDLKESINQLTIDTSVPPSSLFRGGESKAEVFLDKFISEKILRFESFRKDPSKDFLSHMSPYLHFGQISPLYIALKLKAKAPAEAYRYYLEELIVRRELAINHVFYNSYYDQFKGLPRWAKSTLEKHQYDTRKVVYSLAELEHALTHDPYWNAAQQEMMISGKMHGYMRMYWGKKI
ncbi:MAG: deoxyribodipyrimidine photo-lyase, partial [Candidatus Atribacteria bacterium]|nr:deoxyribodipyrimidine photo-lyase [Candidatus Atribacteria bacterium]